MGPLPYQEQENSTANKKRRYKGHIHTHKSVFKNDL